MCTGDQAMFKKGKNSGTAECHQRRVGQAKVWDVMVELTCAQHRKIQSKPSGGCEVESAETLSTVPEYCRGVSVVQCILREAETEKQLDS